MIRAVHRSPGQQNVGRDVTAARTSQDASLQAAKRHLAAGVYTR